MDKKIYTRTTHFKYTLSRYYNIENFISPKEIPEKDFQKILNAIKNQNIENVDEDSLKYVLHMLGMAKYYEHANRILHKINNKDLPYINWLQLNVITQIFEEFSRVYNNRHPCIHFPHYLSVMKKIIDLMDLYSIDVQENIFRHDDFEDKWNDVWNNSNLPFLVKKYHTGVIKIQCFWRKILARRKLLNLKIKQELEYRPCIGIRYFGAMQSFKKLI